jgi:hypothetical protein
MTASRVLPQMLPQQVEAAGEAQNGLVFGRKNLVPREITSRFVLLHTALDPQKRLHYPFTMEHAGTGIWAVLLPQTYGEC